jgi:hypothetical protein
VRTIPLQRGFHRERRRAKSNGTTSAAALARRGGDAVEASKDWGPGSKENEPLSGLHLIAARLPQRRTGAGPYLAPTKVEGEASHRRSDSGRAEEKRAGRPMRSTRDEPVRASGRRSYGWKTLARDTLQRDETCTRC